MKQSILFALFSTLILVSTSLATDDLLVSVLATTDLHGALMPYDYGRGVEVPEIGLVKLASLVKARRRLDPHAILIDVGDTYQGNPMVHLANKDETLVDHPLVSAMNAMAYDVFVPGNHDFDYGLALLKRLKKQARFAFVAANAIDVKTKKPRWESYVIKEVNGVRIGIIGLSSPGIPGWLPKDNWKGLQFDGSIETVSRLMPKLRGQERCDIIVVAFHGGPTNRHNDGDPSINNGYELARKVKGIDLLLLGHTHQVVSAEQVGNTMIMQAGSYSHTLAEVRFRLKPYGDGYRVVRKSGRIFHNGANIPADDEVESLVRSYHEETVALMNTHLATVNKPMALAEAAYKDNELMDLIQQIQLDYTGAQLSVCSVFDPYVTIEGGVTLRHLFKLYPYENDLYAVEMTGKQIKLFLENAARAYKYENGQIGIADKFPLFNLDQLHGLSYRVDPRRPEGQRVLDLKENGRAVSDRKKYTVAMNSYRAGGTGGYDVVRGIPIIKKSDISVRDIIAQWLKKNGHVLVKKDNNWQIQKGAKDRFIPLVK